MVSIMGKLKFDSSGLLTAVIQNINTGQVLMVAMMNSEAVEKTLKTRRAHFWSRSRKSLWQKGETSGNFMDVQEFKIDCDQDAILLKVIPRGPACHTGNVTCFYTEMGEDNVE